MKNFFLKKKKKKKKILDKTLKYYNTIVKIFLIIYR